MALELPRISRRAFLAATAAGLGTIALAACGQTAAGSPSGSAAPPGSSAAAAGSSGAPSDWKQQWDSWVDGAKKEGTLVLATGASPEARVKVPEAFKKAFGVDIQYLGGSSSELANRLRSEQAANQYTVDVSISGAGTSYSTFYAEKMVSPIKPYIINPEALDPNAWTGGKGGVWYMDPTGEYFARIANIASPQIVVNTDFMKADGLNSWNDLLKPEYKGKAIALDPTQPGSGEQCGAYLYKTLGPDWAKRFYLDQQPGLTLDDRVMADSVAHGKYPIAVGERGEDIVKLQSDGFKVTVLNSWSDAPGYVSAAFGLLGMFKNPPHPNAAKLFLNWMLMKDGQTAWNSAWKTASVRKDVSNDWVPDFLVPKAGVNYADAYDWDYSSGGVEVTGSLQATRQKIRTLLADRPKG